MLKLQIGVNPIVSGLASSWEAGMGESEWFVAATCSPLRSNRATSIIKDRNRAIFKSSSSTPSTPCDCHEPLNIMKFP
jgi:hypothetical protein